MSADPDECPDCGSSEVIPEWWATPDASEAAYLCADCHAHFNISGGDGR